MKIKNFLTKTLLVAAGLCVGASNAWGEDIVETYDFGTWGKAHINSNTYATMGYTSAGFKVNNVDMYLLDVTGSKDAEKWDLSNRFAGSNNVTYRYPSGSTATPRLGNENASGVRYISIINLKAGDRINLTCSNLTFFSTNATYDDAGSPTAVVVDGTVTSGTTYTITGEGTQHLDFKIASRAWGNITYATITRTVECAEPTKTITGAYNEQRKFTLTCATEGATIYYSETEKAIGDDGWLEYSSEVTTSATTIWAYAKKDGNSSVISFSTGAGTTLTLNAPVIKWNSFTQNGLFYNPTYTFSQDQSSIIGSPAATMEYKFAEGEYTEGTSYTATATGRLTVKVSAAGYTSAETYIDIAEAKYAQAYTADFSTLTVGDGTGASSQTFNNAGCDFYNFENSFSDKVTLSGFSLAKKISAPADVQGIFARGGDGTITYTGEFPSNSAIYFSCASRTAWYSLVATTNTQNIAQYNGVYNMTVYVPTDDISIAIANCKAYETSDAFATAIAGQSFTSADEVYAFHTSWQIAQADAASSNDITKVIFDAGVSDFTRWNNARSNSGEQYTGAPDAKYFDAWNGNVSDASQTIYGLPAGTYTLKAATRASAGLTDADKFNVWVWDGTSTTKVLGNHIGNTGGCLRNGWGWTIVEFTVAAKANVSIGFYSLPPTDLWAGADDYHLYKGTLSESVTIASSGFSTIASAYALDCANLPSGLKAYKVSSISASAATLEEVTTAVAAGTGLILVGTKSTAYNIPVVASGSDISATNKLQAAVTATDIAANAAYILQGGLFHKVTAASTVPAGKAYLLASDITSAPSLSFVFADEDMQTTGISDVRSKTEDVRGDFFDLSGRRVAQPTKGLYIVNGKKVLVP